MRRRTQAGFTLSEILAVLGIVSLILLMVVPSFSVLLPRRRFDAEVRQLATDITYQRLRAVGRRETTSISYNATERTYTLQPYGIERRFSDDVVSAVIPTVEFNSRGLVTSGSAVNITITGKQSMQRDIEVSPAGRIKMTGS